MTDLPVFHRVPMTPTEWLVCCPVCGEGVPVPEVDEDDAGIWHASREHCIVECECGAYIEPYGATVTQCIEPPYRQRNW